MTQDPASEEQGMLDGLERSISPIMERSAYRLESIALTGSYPATEIEMVIVSRAEDARRLGVRSAIWDSECSNTLSEEPIVERMISYLFLVGTNWRSMTPEEPSATDSYDAHPIRWYRPK
jgi:hypothetical protein